MASIRTKVWLLLVWYIGSVECQTQDPRYYNRDYQDRYDNTYLYNNRRYGRPNNPGEDDYNRGYGGNDDRYQVSSPSHCEKRSTNFAQKARNLKKWDTPTFLGYHLCWQKVNGIGWFRFD